MQKCEKCEKETEVLNIVIRGTKDGYFCDDCTEETDEVLGHKRAKITTQKKVKEFIKKTYTKEQQETMKAYCKENVLKITCDVCRFKTECDQVNEHYQHYIINGKKIGTFFLCDI